MALDRENRFAVLPFDDPVGQALLAPLSPEKRERSMHVVSPDGRIESAGTALITLSRLLPGGNALADAAGGSLLLRGVYGWAYHLAASHRGLLSALVPDVAGPVRPPQVT